MGLGVFYVSDRVQVAVMPRKMEGARSEWLRECLREEQKYYAPAGNNRSDFVSGFRLTCDSLRRVVENEPGILLAEAMKKITHHYHNDTSAYSIMGQWVRRGNVRGIEGRKEKGRIRLYPKEINNETNR